MFKQNCQASWIQILKLEREYLLVVFYHTKLNMFWFISLDQTKKAIWICQFLYLAGVAEKYFLIFYGAELLKMQTTARDCNPNC